MHFQFNSDYIYEFNNEFTQILKKYNGKTKVSERNCNWRQKGLKRKVPLLKRYNKVK